MVKHILVVLGVTLFAGSGMGIANGNQVYNNHFTPSYVYPTNTNMNTAATSVTAPAKAQYNYDYQQYQPSQQWDGNSNGNGQYWNQNQNQFTGPSGYYNYNGARGYYRGAESQPQAQAQRIPAFNANNGNQQFRQFQQNMQNLQNQQGNQHQHQQPLSATGENEPPPPFVIPTPMMEPIRRMYHVYEDNVRGFAKRFRNIVYAPIRMMG